MHFRIIQTIYEVQMTLNYGDKQVLWGHEPRWLRERSLESLVSLTQPQETCSVCGPRIVKLRENSLQLRVCLYIGLHTHMYIYIYIYIYIYMYSTQCTLLLSLLRAALYDIRYIARISQKELSIINMICLLLRHNMF